MKTLIKTVTLGAIMLFCVLSSYGQTPQKNDLQKEKWIKDDFVIHKNLETYELDIAEKLRISKYLTDEWNQKK